MKTPAFSLAYHGCDEGVGEKILKGIDHVFVSQNDYDWLGHGTYFWENSPRRAFQWAEFVKENPQHFYHKIKRPFVVGAIIDLGNCLDLTDAESLEIVANSYRELEETFDDSNSQMPTNEPSHKGDYDLVKRHLDCAVINFVHDTRRTQKLPLFDTVRGIFTESGALFPGAKIMTKTHMQICVLNPKISVKGYFRPLN